MDYLIRLAQAHEFFRRPELEALCRLTNVKIDIVFYSETSPFCVMRFLHATEPNGGDAETMAKELISHSILSRAIYELWGWGTTYDELHDDVRRRSRHLWERYGQTTFKFSFDSYCGKRSSDEQREIIDGFQYLGFQGPIRMRRADVEFTVFEEWESPESFHLNRAAKRAELVEVQSKVSDAAAPEKPHKLLFGRLIAPSSRQLAEKHDLKKRPYISTTSMDAELALVTATLALAGPGKLFLDPFVGTGGFMVAAAELGAMTMGTDIDGRSFRGKGRGIEKGVGRNFKKYGLESFFVDCVTSDLVNTPLRLPRRGATRWLDGIICDPPYGVREGLKVLGTRSLPSANKEGSESKMAFLIDGIPAYTLPGYVAPKKPYSFTRMLDNVLEFATMTLVDGGRLAFWMPTANEEQDEAIDIPKHASLELLHECVQPFNKWSRRLLIYQRRKAREGDDKGEQVEVRKAETHVNGNAMSADELNPFRKKYFQGFETRKTDN